MTNPIYEKVNSPAVQVSIKKPEIINNPNDTFQTVLFLPEGKEHQGKGGLRTKGYFKKSYDHKPLISIITIVYNGEKYLEDTIESVIKQTYDNIEYIIIDGHSTDRTLDIIKKYEDKIDYWVSEKDQGISDAFNKGIICCTGDFIGIINADDFYENKAIECVAKTILAHKGIDVIHGQMKYWFDQNRSLTMVPDTSRLQTEMSLFHPSIFVSKKTYLKYGLFKLRYKYAMDYELMLRFFVNQRQFLFVDYIFSNMRAGGESNQFVIKSIQEMRHAQLEYFDNSFFFRMQYLLLFSRRLLSIIIKKIGLYFVISWYQKYKSIR